MWFLPQFIGLETGRPFFPSFVCYCYGGPYLSKKKIVMEALSRMFERARLGNVISGFSVGGISEGQLEFSRLLFADYMLIFRGADPEQIWHLIAGFVWFQIISGLKINLGKSDLVLVGDVFNVEVLAGILRCQVAMLPMTYLGLPLGATFKSKAIWTVVLEKMERRLAGWKRL